MDDRIRDAREIMLAFAARTGLTTDERPPQRYLWTDAFAVCTLLELYRRTEDAAYRSLALALVDQVHHVLGRHRPDDARTGWISGLDDTAGARHPTQGGLRIGKPLPERDRDAPFDERLAWERDGQYYHYLTKWMHALNRVAAVTGDLTYNRWARELAQTVHAAFTLTPPGSRRPRLVWKMSIDLSYPLVPSMGQHDPLDGYITYNELQATASQGGAVAGPDLSAEIEAMTDICEGLRWATDDPLGLGGVLTDAYRVAQLRLADQLGASDLLAALLDAARQGLHAYRAQRPLAQPAAYRLAFRELGLAIGLAGLAPLQALVAAHPERFRRPAPVTAQIAALRAFAALDAEITDFWRDPAHQRAASWTDHEDINAVMLATRLIPDTFLEV